MSGIFVNYRQTRHVGDDRVLCEHAQLVEAIVERLGRHFGRDRVFLDTEMRLSARYPTELRARLAASELVIAVIHDRWLVDLRDRAARPEPDWVRFELATALADGKHVLPVLIGSSGLPGGPDLFEFEDLAELALRQAHRIRFGHWRQDLDRLIQQAELVVAPDALPEPREEATRPERRWHGIAAAAVLGLLAPYTAARLLDTAPPWLVAIAIVLLVLLFVPLGIVGVTYAARRWLDSLDAHAAATAHDTRTNVIVGLTITGFGIVFLLTNDAFSFEARMLSLAVITGFAVTLGANWLREHGTASDWPKPALAADPAAIRGALARLRGHLDTHQAPLTRLHRDQARFALDQIRRAHERLREQSSLDRRSWLRAASPALTWPHTALLGATVGTAVAALLRHWETGGREWTAPVLAAGAVAVAACLHLATVDLAHRLRRWRLQTVVAAVPDLLDELERRLDASSVPALRHPGDHRGTDG